MKELIKKTGIELSEMQLEQFEKYYEFLIEKNKVMNLTGITKRDEVIEKHFEDSLSISKIVDLKKVKKVIDVGTGAGFPGVPLKIAFPHLEIVLLDSLNKRIEFLKELIEKLKITNIYPLHERAEVLAKDSEYREQFDICTSRAVANLSTLSEYCLPFVKINGYFISYKSGNFKEELNQAKNPIQTLGGKIERVEEFKLSDRENTRSLIKIIKENQTPGKYPRKAGAPQKSPLK